MARVTLLECEFLIPLRGDCALSDGKPHSQRAWKWLEKELFQFGGATLANTTFEGSYVDKDTGKRVSDTSWKYAVAIPRSHVGALRTVLRSACTVFAQKCIYLSIAGHVEFLEREDDDSDKNEKKD